jgi:hypothetical protein
MTCDGKPHIHSQGGSTGGNNTQNEMVSPGIIMESALKSPAVTAYELVASVYDHLGRVGAFGGEPRGVHILPVREHRSGIWIVPAKIVPVRYMLTYAHNQLAGAGLLQVDLAQESIGGRAA